MLVNGRRVEFLSGLDTPLKDSDTVQIFPVVAGAEPPLPRQTQKRR